MRVDHDNMDAFRIENVKLQKINIYAFSLIRQVLSMLCTILVQEVL